MMTNLNVFLLTFLVGIVSLYGIIGFGSNSVELFKISSIFSDYSKFSLPSAYGEVIFDNTGLNTGLFSTVNPGIINNGLFSTVNPQLLGSTAAPGPTFNPPLKKCSTTAPSTDLNSGGFDMAKYMITGDVDKDKLKGKDFNLQVFADLVKDDEVEIKGDDAPYKANWLTNNEKDKAKVKLQEIATICIDVQNVVNIEEKTKIDPKDSPVFESLDY